MKKIKLKLNKKIITELNRLEMQQAQGGHSYYLCNPSDRNCDPDPSANCPTTCCPSAQSIICPPASGNQHSYYSCC